MKKTTMEVAAKAVTLSKTKAGRMNIDELYRLCELATSGALADAFIMAYNAGYYRGAVAAQCGRFKPGEAVKI